MQAETSQELPEGEEPVGTPGSYPQRPGEQECAYYLKTGTCKFGAKCKFHHPPGIVPSWGAVTPATEFTVGLNKEQYPRRPGEQQCSFFLKTGTCKFKATCKFDHPPEAVQQTLQLQGAYPMRPGEQQCAYYLKTGKCKFGATCRFDHPPMPPGTTPDPAMLGAMGPPRPPGPGMAGVGVGVGVGPYPAMGPTAAPMGMVPPPAPMGYYPDASGMHHMAPMPMPGPPQAAYGQLPQRPGEKECTFFLKTGRCQYGARCKFHHPLEKLPSNIAPVNLPPMGMAPMGPPMYPAPGMAMGAYGYQGQPAPPMRDPSVDMLPQRPGQEPCSYYMRTGKCAYGATCKFDHPRSRAPTGPDGYQGGGMNGVSTPNGDAKGYGYQTNGGMGATATQQPAPQGGPPSAQGPYNMQMNGPGGVGYGAQGYPPQGAYGAPNGAYPNGGDAHYASYGYPGAYPAAVGYGQPPPQQQQQPPPQQQQQPPQGQQQPPQAASPQQSTPYRQG